MFGVFMPARRTSNSMDLFDRILIQVWFAITAFIPFLLMYIATIRAESIALEDPELDFLSSLVPGHEFVEFWDEHLFLSGLVAVIAAALFSRIFFAKFHKTGLLAAFSGGMTALCSAMLLALVTTLAAVLHIAPFPPEYSSKVVSSFSLIGFLSPHFLLCTFILWIVVCPIGAVSGFILHFSGFVKKENSNE